MRRGVTYLGAALLGLGTMAAPARASCDMITQFPIEQMDHAVLRSILTDAMRDVTEFFDIQLSDLCVDDGEFGPYYDVDRNLIALHTDFMLRVANPPGNINRAISVLAHEGAHAFQAKHGLYDNLRAVDQDRVKCIELHADFIAGGYMAWRARRYNMDVKNLTEFFFNLGDDDTAYVGHHGKGPERFLSFRAGFNTGIDDEITLSSLGIGYVSQTNCD